MGGKRSGKGKHIHLCVALLILLGPVGCAYDQLMSVRMTDVSGDEARAHLALGRKYLGEGKFGSALEENEKVLLLAGRSTPTHEALFAIGLIHAHFDNLGKDYGKSLEVLRRLIRDYPTSAFAQQAKVIVGLIEDNYAAGRRIEKLNSAIAQQQRSDADAEAKKTDQAKRTDQAKTAEQTKTIAQLAQENEKLHRTIEKLNTIIDELKKVDIDVDQKKREKAK